MDGVDNGDVMKSLILILALLLPGCATIDLDRVVVGWPQMQTTETKVTTAEASAHCRKTQSDRCSGTSGMIAITSCYQWNFDTKHDWIWYGSEDDLEHERMHHKGHPHLGEGPNSIMQCYLDEWRSNKERDS